MRNDERRKLTASWLNILAAGVISSGSVAQLIIEASGDHGRSTVGRTLITAAICLAVGLILHALARSLVGSDRAE
jgi:formate/nitrite transporter FocA (FNT family)